VSEPTGFEEEEAPDPARASAGWTRRFTARGVRAEEMIQLYRSLGYEVVADPVTSNPPSEACVGCSLPVQLEYRTIYTRRRTAETDSAPETGAQS